MPRYTIENDDEHAARLKDYHHLLAKDLLNAPCSHDDDLVRQLNQFADFDIHASFTGMPHEAPRFESGYSMHELANELINEHLTTEDPFKEKKMAAILTRFATIGYSSHPDHIHPKITASPLLSKALEDGRDNYNELPATRTVHRLDAAIGILLKDNKGTVRDQYARFMQNIQNLDVITDEQRQVFNIRDSFHPAIAHLDVENNRNDREKLAAIMYNAAKLGAYTDSPAHDAITNNAVDPKIKDSKRVMNSFIEGLEEYAKSSSQSPDDANGNMLKWAKNYRTQTDLLQVIDNVKNNEEVIRQLQWREAATAQTMARDQLNSDDYAAYPNSMINAHRIMVHAQAFIERDQLSDQQSAAFSRATNILDQLNLETTHHSHESQSDMIEDRVTSELNEHGNAYIYSGHTEHAAFVKYSHENGKYYRTEFNAGDGATHTGEAAPDSGRLTVWGVKKQEVTGHIAEVIKIDIKASKNKRDEVPRHADGSVIFPANSLGEIIKDQSVRIPQQEVGNCTTYSCSLLLREMLPQNYREYHEMVAKTPLGEIKRRLAMEAVQNDPDYPISESRDRVRPEEYYHLYEKSFAEGIRSDNADSVNLALGSGVDPNTKVRYIKNSSIISAEVEPALITAVKQNNYLIADHLLNYGVDTNAKDHTYKTALMYVISKHDGKADSSFEPLADLLITHPTTDLSLTDFYNRTPQMIAKENGNEWLTKRLEQQETLVKEHLQEGIEKKNPTLIHHALSKGAYVNKEAVQQICDIAMHNTAYAYISGLEKKQDMLTVTRQAMKRCGLGDDKSLTELVDNASKSLAILIKDERMGGYYGYVPSYSQPVSHVHVPLSAADMTDMPSLSPPSSPNPRNNFALESTLQQNVEELRKTLHSELSTVISDAVQHERINRSSSPVTNDAKQQDETIRSPSPQTMLDRVRQSRSPSPEYSPPLPQTMLDRVKNSRSPSPEIGK